MFTIYYILNERINTKKCKNEQELKIIYRSLIKQGAIIKVIRDQYGYKIDKILT